MENKTRIQDDFVPKIFRSWSSFLIFLLFLFGLPFILYTIFTFYQMRVLLKDYSIKNLYPFDHIILVTATTALILLFITVFFAMAWGYTIKNFNINKKVQTEREMRNLYHLSLKKAEMEQMELFSFICTHNLREPLNKISLFANLVKSEGGILTEKQRFALERILDSNQKMNDQITKIQEFVTIMAEDEVIEKIDIKQLIQQRLGLHKEFIASAKMKIEVGDLPVIYSDRKKLTKIIDCLVENSIKFHKKSTPPRIKVHGHQDRDSVSIHVEDNGIGIPRRYLQQLFKPFKRLHSKEFKGFGIGLATCKKLALALGGDIRLTSESGKGTEVTITLPSDLSKAANHQKEVV